MLLPCLVQLTLLKTPLKILLRFNRIAPQFGERGSTDTDPLRDLTSMCPNLKMLAYKAKDSNWPSSTPAWPLLEELYLDYGEDWDTLFRDVELNHYLPNLKTFFLTNYSMNLLPGTKFN